MHNIITLQLAALSDAHDIARMAAAFIERDLPHNWTPQRVAHHIRHRESVVLIAKSSRQLVGFAIMQFADTTAHLNLLAVSPHARRRGIARQLLEWLHETARVAGTFVVNLELRASNAEARQFYNSLGYVDCSYVPRYYDNIEDAVRMSRDLAAHIIE